MLYNLKILCDANCTSTTSNLPLSASSTLLTIQSFRHRRGRQTASRDVHRRLQDERYEGRDHDSQLVKNIHRSAGDPVAHSKRYRRRSAKKPCVPQRQPITITDRIIAEKSGKISPQVDPSNAQINGIKPTALQPYLVLDSGLGKDNEHTFKRDSRLAHTLENLDNPTEEKMDISAVSWNASGVIVAAGYAKFEHETTCSHKSVVCLWGIFKRNFKATRPETISVPVQLPIMVELRECFEFSPQKTISFCSWNLHRRGSSLRLLPKGRPTFG